MCAAWGWPPGAWARGCTSNFATLGRFLALPGHGVLEPALERDVRQPAECPARLLDVHDAAANIVDVAPVRVLRLRVHADDSPEQQRQLVHACFGPGRKSRRLNSTDSDLSRMP